MPDLTRQEILRYSRQLTLPEIGVEGQQRLKAASALVVGAGGLGAPVSMYLVAAGVGRIGLVDFDRVDFTNLHRQLLYGTPDVGRPKLEVAAARLKALNPEVRLDLHAARVSSANALDLVRPYDIVIDGTDNFPTRYCTNDACVMLGKPNVYGSIFRFEGQATVFDPRRRDGRPQGPCYRCLYPEPPPPGMVPSCAEGGVLGILPGVIGCIQATEALKLLLDIPTTLVGRLLRYDALAMTFREYRLRRDPACPVCGEKPTITSLIDYEQFCGIRGEESTTIIRAQPVPAISVRELQAALAAGQVGDGAAELIDVREPAEFAICRIAGAKLLPLSGLAGRVHEFRPGKRYYVLCKMGGRSATAVEALRREGIDAVNVAGGILAWAKEIDPSLPTY